MKKKSFAPANGGGWESWDPLTPLYLRPCIVFKDHPHHLTNYENKGTKISVFKLFSELAMKIWKFNLGFSKIPISHLFYELGKAWKSKC